MLLPIIRKGLHDADLYVREVAVEMIPHAPESEQKELRAMLLPIIREELQDTDFTVREVAARMIAHAPESERVSLIREGLQHTDFNVRAVVARMIAHAPESEQEELRKIYYTMEIKEVDESKLQNIAFSTPLYNGVSEDFARQLFPKTGSRLTLLGSSPMSPDKDKKNSLQGRVIIRHILFPSYNEWSRAFESPKFWKEEGFDYVPVEPVLRARLDPKISVDVAVFTRVLGPSVAEWQGETNLFSSHINKEMDRILKALEKFGVEHGHANRGNFCLVFHRSEDGKANFTRPPRVYMIDFDQARFRIEESSQ